MLGPLFDISHEGIGMILDVDIRRGTHARLYFPLPMSPEHVVDIVVIGVCTHSHLSGKVGGFKTGMKYVDAPSQMTEAIKAFMAL